MIRKDITTQSSDFQYLQLLVARIRVCKNYKPQFGQGRSQGLSLQDFQKLYSADIFYSWFGLNNSMMYAAHKAAGGITSIYRQIGIGCEEVFRKMLQANLGLDKDQSKWSYQSDLQDGRKRKLSLDGRIVIADIKSEEKRGHIRIWLKNACDYLGIAPEIASVLKGAVFEVRQGYKSKDSKRQNADIANAATAYSQGYLPVVIMLSAQIDNDIALRYENEKWLILRGQIGGTSTQSTYSFCKEVIGYDLAHFFQTNAPALQVAIVEVLETLLNAGE